MRRWERRLKDLALALNACGSNYFEPELFRLNANHFLTTSRTVSFLFQKDKGSIEGFDAWHAENIVKPWGADLLMKWSIVSRNAIEKEGDLDLHSKVSATLIFSYLEEQDVSLELEKQACLSVGVKRLVRFARAKLPSGVSDTAVIKIERTWVANTLPDCELLQAFRYIYARMFEACTSLAHHLGTKLELSIPHPTSFDEVLMGSRGVQYVKLNAPGVGTITAQRHDRDPDFVPPGWLAKLSEERLSDPPNSLETLVRFHGKMAEANFLQFGNHMAMLWLFNEKFQPIDYIATIPEDQASKFIFWRAISDRIHYLNAKSLVWVSEAWVRKGIDKGLTQLIRNLPIVGEFLQVAGIDGQGKHFTITWDIKREHPDAQPNLQLKDPSIDKNMPEVFYYLVPARRALEKVGNGKQ